MIALDSSLQLPAGPACRVCDAYEILIRTYLWMDSGSNALATAEEYTRRIPDSPRTWSSLMAVAWATSDSLRATQAETEFFRLIPGARRSGISEVALYQIARGNYGSAEVQLLAQARADDQLQGDARWYIMTALRNQGRLREALRLAQGNLPRSDPWWGLDPRPDQLNSAIIEYEQGNPASCIRFMESAPQQTSHKQLAADWPGQAAREEAWALARLVMCRASQGDTLDFTAIADTLERLGAISNYGRDRRLHHYVRGLLWKARRKPAQAVVELQAAISSPNFGFTRINYELGQLLLQLGRPGDAVAILQPALRGALDASNLYLSRTEIHELLAKAWDSAGRADSARVHWAEVERSWRGADPQFHARWEVARAKSR
jgi:tetratricopeptide (TPR) repeat protein